MNKTDILMKVAEKAPGLGRAALQVQKASPEILLVTGIAAIGVGTFLACRSTLKLDTIMDHIEEEKNEIADAQEVYGDEYSDSDAKKDLTKVYVKSGVEIAKSYLPAVATIGLGVGCVIGCHNIQQGRIVALSAAYKVVQTGFQEYRDKVVAELGEEKDQEFYFRPTKEKVEVVETLKNGKEKTVEKEVQTVQIDGASTYAIQFDETCSQWRRQHQYNVDFLRMTQSYMNDKLRLLGHVFLNDVYEALGASPTPAGQMVGWVYEGDGDNCINFGIDDLIYNGQLGQDYVNGAVDKPILLDFNVDGVMFDRI